MTKQEFSVWAKQNLIYLDGATGSNLIMAGMPSGVNPEKWILEHPDVLIDLQREYAAAGSNIVYAPTFSANRIKLAEYGMEKEIETLTAELVELSRKAVGKQALVAGDITMTGRQLKPIGNMDLEELIDVYKQQIRCLTAAGVDLLVVETMMSLQETRAAVIAAKEVCDLPVLVTMTFEKNGRTLYGTDAVTAAVVMESLGASAVGVNCSAGPGSMAEIVRAMAEVTQIPVIAKPNAGMPSIDQAGRTCYDMEPEQFAEEMTELIRAGASIVGGCCGTTPEYIRLLRQRAGTVRQNVSHKGCKREGMRFLTSERNTLSFGPDDGFLVIGERINPTGKKKLQASLLEGSLEMVLDFAEEQEECGARILDVNMGMNGIDEKAMMLQAVEELSAATHLPLSIDSSHVDVIEAALRRYPGRALINSISLEREKFEKLLPIARKYGAMFILLPLSDAGLPADMEEKKRIINTVYERAASLGCTKEDVVVDGLVNTVGANSEAALQALETIRYCKEQGFATVCGLSNISFGMPERGFVNAAFLTMAIAQGLTMAIANPSQELLMGCAAASDMLMAKRGADMRYIEAAGKIKEKRESEARKAETRKTEQTKAEQPRAEIRRENETENKSALYESVLKGNRQLCVEAAGRALEEGADAQGLLNGELMPAINRVGELFERGKYFLPQLIASAEAMKCAIEVLEPHLAAGKQDGNLPVVVIATVEGDIHDIGKNLVALMLKNCGFRVIDLGKDVPGEKIVEAAREHDAAIIGLSALMTTTMTEMKKVVKLVRESGLKAKVIIGGAVITQEYADEIGADGYSRDAADAVKLVKRLTEKVEID
ncbi:MAG: dihydropteroate synthase [Lachnospiraceae bacterium]|nr:dihydropteroate synthase [Lachnospiraceae bacterium]